MNLMEGTLAKLAIILRVIVCIICDYYDAIQLVEQYIVISQYMARIQIQSGHFLGNGTPASSQSSSISASTFSSFTFSLQASQNSSKSSPFIMALMPNLVSPVRWSVILSCGQLQVRIFSLRSIVVTCNLRRDCSSSTDFLYSISKSRCLRRSVARFLFMSWLRSSWIKTCRPEGMWVARQADSILLTACPPGPLDRVNWYLMSLGSTSKEKGTTGITTIEMVLECNRPFASVSGTLITLCTPASVFSTFCAPSPCTRMSRNLQPALTPDSFPEAVVQHFQPCMPQNASYISLMSFTKMVLSAPPAPGRNSRMISVEWSYLAGGISSSHRSSLIQASLSVLAWISSCSNFFSDWSLVSFIISLIWAILSWWDLISSQAVRTGASCASSILSCSLFFCPKDDYECSSFSSYSQQSTFPLSLLISNSKVLSLFFSCSNLEQKVKRDISHSGLNSGGCFWLFVGVDENFKSVLVCV